MGIIPCALPCQSTEEKESDRSNSIRHLSDSSSNSSLSSQVSLPSIPSLTPSEQQELPTKAIFQNLATLSGHSSYIFSLALGGKQLYSGSSTGEIRRWNHDPTKLQNSTISNNIVAEAHSAVKSLAFLNEKLLTAHHDSKIRVWRISDSKTMTFQKYKWIATLPTWKDSFMRLFSAKNYVEVRRHKKCTWVHHVDAVSVLAVTYDGVFLYSVSWDRAFKVWRTSDFKCIESVGNAHDDAINAIALSNDGYVYTGSADKRIRVWKKQEFGEVKKKHSLVATLEKHKSGVNVLAISKDGTLLYSGAGDRSIIVWEKEKMVAVGALRGHGKAILCLSVVGDLVCSGSADKTVRMWRRESGNSHSCLGVLEGHKGPVKCLAASVSNDDDDDSRIQNPCFGGRNFLLYSGSLDCNIKIWKVSFFSV